MSVEYELKQQLDSIIDYAYKDASLESDPKLNTYKWYKIVFKNRKVKTFNGRYCSKGRIIEMYPKGYANENKYKTLIHELAHHIQFQKYGKYNPKYECSVLNEGIKAHGDEFYNEYQKLLYAALDLNILNYQDMINMPKNSDDYTKIQDMLSAYCPTDSNNVNTEKSSKRIYCYNSYNQKDSLKENGYSYNVQIKAWHKPIEDGQVEKEKEYLQELGIKDSDIIIKDALTMLDMMPEVKKERSSKCYIVQYNFNKNYVLCSNYGELKKLKSKCPYIKIKQYDSLELAAKEMNTLEEAGIINGLVANIMLDDYVKEYVKRNKKEKRK